MREFSTQISKALLQGLKPNESIDDTMFFDDCYNLVSYDMSLRSYEPVRSIADGSSFKFPFPQWISLQNDSFLFTGDKLLRTNKEFIPFDLETPPELVKWDFPRTDQPFDVIDYEKNWFAINADGCMYEWQGSIKATTALKCNAAVKYKNRTVLGGPTEGMWTDHFRDALLQYAPTGFMTDSLKSNFILWSSFDSEDFPYCLVEPSVMQGRDWFDNLIEKGEFGFMEMPFDGAVIDMYEVQDQLFVFGEDGVVSLAQSEGPGATLAQTGQQDFGLKQRNSVGGDNESMVFIDKLNYLWYISPDGLRRLDYRDYMSQLNGYIYISKHPSEETFYIGDEDLSFVLNQGKLTRVSQTVSATDGGYENLTGMSWETGGNEAVIETDKVDLGIPSNKTLTGIFISANRPVAGKAWASADVGGRRVEGRRVNLNPEGYAATRIYGKNHKIHIRFDSYKNLSIDRIELKWQVDDNRQTRGFLTTENASGSG